MAFGIELAEKHKATGNTFFKAGSLEDAVEAYTKGYDLVKEMADNDGDDGAKAKALAVALALNGAQGIGSRDKEMADNDGDDRAKAKALAVALALRGRCEG
ncbi:hypothetical protein T484DRAFT_1864404 [Baffinella frigidus]|nr:hypothetical protein T484DRAFT_1864404 [Cryptophyta sp. CCMP2293]